ncbi:MAG: hypothetical protein WAW60_03295 [Candidatus Saccharimonadales bacterium]
METPSPYEPQEKVTFPKLYEVSDETIQSIHDSHDLDSQSDTSPVTLQKPPEKRSGEVVTKQFDPEVIRVALKEAQGDIRRLEFFDDGSIVVRNSSDWRRRHN